MKNFLIRNADAVFCIAVALILFAILMFLTACGAMRSAGLVGGGAGVGAAVGSLGGPAGAIGGAAVGGAITSAVVESDAATDRADRLEDRIYPPLPYEPKPTPWQLPHWGWLLTGLWIWLRRAHLMDAITGKEPRLDAILRALGIRTHKTQRKPK